MTAIFDRCIVRFSLTDGKSVEVYMYGATPNDLRSEQGFDRIVKSAQRLGIDIGTLDYDIFPVEHPLPARCVRHVYTRGRRAAEFV